MVLAAFLTGRDGKNAWRIYKRDRLNHKSPNSAHNGGRLRRARCASGWAETAITSGSWCASRPSATTAAPSSRRISGAPTACCMPRRSCSFSSQYSIKGGAHMAALIHGGDTEGYILERGGEPLDFSANCNPLGIRRSVPPAVLAAAAKADRYPDPLCRRLCGALSERLGVPADWILCGNGAAEPDLPPGAGQKAEDGPRHGADLRGIRTDWRWRPQAAASCVFSWSPAAGSPSQEDSFAVTGDSFAVSDDILPLDSAADSACSSSATPTTPRA